MPDFHPPFDRGAYPRFELGTAAAIGVAPPIPLPPGNVQSAVNPNGFFNSSDAFLELDYDSVGSGNLMLFGQVVGSMTVSQVAQFELRLGGVGFLSPNMVQQHPANQSFAMNIFGFVSVTPGSTLNRFYLNLYPLPLAGTLNVNAANMQLIVWELP